ncbi:DUF992 domain-containing protein [Hyphomicrobium sp.]|uniref:DUF992 domain-containing protein n=1 Tax=Hyphomicrobium sp. TaxID=82 RepID=UPI002E37C278|nr:DUF992 domain-containing protein [Hyphomicrobium sp.]HEX2839790.1 DUF992 domain-containing protein [Hyphomicrobium sp.]
MKSTGIAFAVLAAVSVLAHSPAAAQAKIKVGTLTCTGGAGVGLVLGSKKSYSCTYSSVSGKSLEDYAASITKIGLDIGVTEKSVIVWTVLASADALDPRALAGNYAGATADVAIGIGGGAKVLVGGSNNSIVLQPVSVQGQTGLNLAVGVAELSIR